MHFVYSHFVYSHFVYSHFVDRHFCPLTNFLTKTFLICQKAIRIINISIITRLHNRQNDCRLNFCKWIAMMPIFGIQWLFFASSKGSGETETETETENAQKERRDRDTQDKGDRDKGAGRQRGRDRQPYRKRGKNAWKRKTDRQTERTYLMQKFVRNIHSSI